MTIRINKAFLAFLILAMGLMGTVASPQTTQPLPKIRIVLAGDSTVTPEAGWGAGFTACVGEGAEVTNLARGGRSSKSFIDEGLWKKVLEARPDYVLIQFGHNDQKPDEARHTDPQTTYRQYMTQYVDTAIAARIKPILVTSISRRQWGKNGNGKIHSTLQPYVDVVKEIAEQKHVPLIDLHAKSIEIYEKLGKVEVDTISPIVAAKQSPDDPAKTMPPGIDSAHLNSKGGAYFGKVVAQELANAVPELAPYVQVK
jgi:lysophospholipase L1-like esterase